MLFLLLSILNTVKYRVKRTTTRNIINTIGSDNHVKAMKYSFTVYTWHLVIRERHDKITE